MFRRGPGFCCKGCQKARCTKPIQRLRMAIAEPKLSRKCYWEMQVNSGSIIIAWFFGLISHNSTVAMKMVTSKTDL